MNDVGKEEWGPWIEWPGGKPSPVPPGVWVEADLEDLGRLIFKEKGTPPPTSWTVEHGTWVPHPTIEDSYIDPIIRYRVREPDGMRTLRGLLDVVAPARQLEDTLQ